MSSKTVCRNGMLFGMLGVAVLGTGCKSDPMAERAREQRELQQVRDNFDAHPNPEINARTRYAAGQLAEAGGNHAVAIAQYEEALKLDKKNLMVLYRLGVVYAQIKDYDNSIVAWKKYIKATDGSGVGYSNLGYTYELAGMVGEAEQAYRTGIDTDPKGEPCHVNYGLMLARFGRTSEAVIQLQAVLTPAEVHYNLASVYEQLGRKAEARAEYTKAIELDPQLQDARIRMAQLE